MYMYIYVCVYIRICSHMYICIYLDGDAPGQGLSGQDRDSSQDVMIVMGGIGQTPHHRVFGSTAEIRMCIYLSAHLICVCLYILIRIYTCMYIRMYVDGDAPGRGPSERDRDSYGVASVSRLLKIICLFCTRAL